MKETIKVTIPISLKEAALLYLIRSNPYGRYEVTVQENEPIRVEARASHMLTDQDGMVFASKNAKQDTIKPLMNGGMKL